jgi:hypothetical protein
MFGRAGRRSRTVTVLGTAGKKWKWARSPCLLSPFLSPSVNGPSLLIKMPPPPLMCKTYCCASCMDLFVNQSWPLLRREGFETSMMCRFADVLRETSSPLPRICELSELPMMCVADE